MENGLTPWFDPADHPQVGWNDNPNLRQTIRPQPWGGYIEDVGYDDVYLQGNGYDDEIGDLEEIEDEEEEDNMDDEVGANPRALANRRRRRQRRMGRVQQRGARARPGSPRQRKASRVLQRLQQKDAKDAARMRALGASMGLGAGALPPGAGASPTLRAYETNAAQQQARAGEGYRSTILDMPPGGRQARIPFEDNGANRTLLNVPISGVPQTFTLSLQTPQITFAGFQVTGVDISIEIAPGENANGFTPGDILVTVIASNMQVNGDINLFYAPQNIDFAAQTNRSAKRTISGLRANPPLQPNNRATLDLQFIQEIAHGTAYDARLSAALVGTRLYDPRAQSDV